MVRRNVAGLAAAFLLGVGATLFFQKVPLRLPARTGGGPPKIVLVGLDGADWNILDPLMRAGRMPHLSALVTRGVRCRLLTLSPTLSPVIWTSIATGVKPERHGIVDFTAINRETGEAVPVTSNLRRIPALWNRFSDDGRRVGFTGWWASFPAEKVDGFIVSDRIAYQLFGVKSDEKPEGKTWPPEAYDRIKSLIVKPETVPDALVLRFFDDPSILRTTDPEEQELLRQFRTILASGESYRRIAAQLGDEVRPSLESVYFEGTDTVAHLFMRFRPPQMTGVSPDRVRRFGPVIDRYYEYADELLGEIVSRNGDRANYVICSDHGFRTDRDRPASTDSRIDRGRGADWHRKYGILVIAGPAARQGAEVREATVFDIAPTVLALGGIPIPADLDGRVLTEAISEDYQRRFPLRSAEPADVEVASGSPLSPLHAPIATQEDEEIRQKLISLGYLTQESNNAHNNRGILLLGRGEFDKAIAEFRTAVEATPDFAAGRVNIARAYWFKGDDVAAISELRKAQATNPSMREVPLLLGNIALKAGNLAEAEKHCLSALALEPNDTDVLNCLGLVSERRKDWAGAEARYKATVEVDPEFAEGFNNLGNVAKRRGDLAAAESWYGRAIEADPFFMGAYANLALLYQERGDLDRAADLYKQALEKDNANPDLHNNLGSLLFRRGDLVGAEASFRRAIELDARYAEGHNSLGVVFGAQGKESEERAEYEKAIELKTDYADGMYNLALWHVRHGDDSKAERLLGDALRTQPDYVPAMGTLAGIKLKRGDASGARTWVEKALAIQPRNPALLSLLGEVYTRLGDPRSAESAYRRSLEVQPGQPEVAKRLQDLVERNR